MQKSTQSICLFIGFALSACSNGVQVGYTCDPPGAELYENYTEPSRSLGTCPTTVTYDVTEDKEKQGWVPLKGVTAIWPSGASQAVPFTNVDLRSGYTRDVTFTRPRDLPGYENDVKYGRDFERTRMLEEEQQRSNNDVWR